MHLFDKGRKKLRKAILANQKRPGSTPETAELNPWPNGQDNYGGAKLTCSDSLKWEEKRLFIEQADVYGGYQAYTNHEMGRVIQAMSGYGPTRQYPDYLPLLR